MQGERRIKTAMVVIDMATEDRHKIAWGRGCATEGIMRLASVIRTARGAGIRPIMVVCDNRPTLLPELAAAAGPDAPLFRKSLMSAFSLADFSRYLESLRLDSLIVVGWVSHLCVRDTAIDAMREGYRVFISDDLLFYRAGSPPYPMMSDSELRLFGGSILRFPDARSLVAALMHPKSV